MIRTSRRVSEYTPRSGSAQPVSAIPSNKLPSLRAFHRRLERLRPSTRRRLLRLAYCYAHSTERQRREIAAITGISVLRLDCFLGLVVPRRERRA
jgi:hypothetical protein